MKSNYILYLSLLIVILSRNMLLSMTTNLANNLFTKDNNLEIKLVQDQNEYLKYSFYSLLDFKNNLNIAYNYKITNLIRNNYGFDNLIINGSDYRVGDEVVSTVGLIGIVSDISKNTSRVALLHNTNLVVNINQETGKITGKDFEGNLIIKEVSNYNNIKPNDLVYSINNTYVGRVLKIKYDVIDSYVTIKTDKLEDVFYLAVITR